MKFTANEIINYDNILGAINNSDKEPRVRLALADTHRAIRIQKEKIAQIVNSYKEDLEEDSPEEFEELLGKLEKEELKVDEQDLIPVSIWSTFNGETLMALRKLCQNPNS